MAPPDDVTKEAPVKSFAEVGASGLRVTGGRVREELLYVLQGDKAIKVYREMRDNDSVVNALCYGIEQEIRKVDWTVDQGDATEEAAQFLQECHDDMEHPWGDVVSEAASMVQFGWAWMETVYKTRQGLECDPSSDFDDGRIGWRKIALRSQDSLWDWELARNGDILGMNQRTYSDLGSDAGPVLIPANVSLLFRTSHFKNNPEGRSMLRPAYRAWFYKKRIEELEAIGVERDFAGMPVIGVPAELMSPDASSDQTAALEEWKRIGRNLRVDEQACIVYPRVFDENNNLLYDIQLAGTGSRRLFDTTAIITRWATAILQSALADVMQLGHEDVGSRALGDTKQDMLTNGIQALVDEVREQFNRTAVPRLFRLNGMPSPFPKFTTSPVGEIDAGEFVQMVLQYSQAGAPLFPDNDLDNAVREKIGLPERSAEALEMDAAMEQAKLDALQNPPPAPPAGAATSPPTAPAPSPAPKPKPKPTAAAKPKKPSDANKPSTTRAKTDRTGRAT